MATIIDLNGDAEILTGYDGIQRTRRVNGEKEIDFTLHLTEQNEHYFHDIGEVWRIEHGGLTYVVDMISDQSDGDSYTRKIGAVQDFYWNLRNTYRYDSFSGSRTFNDMLIFIFTGTDYVFNISGTFYAQDFENFGDDSILSLFTKALERYQAEFEVNGKIVTLKPKIGNVTDFQYRYQFNINSVTREKDAVDFSTYGEGFGKDGLHVTYTSPLADIFGKLEAPALRDDRYTNKNTLLAAVKQNVDSSLNVSITFDFEDLRASGYPNNVPNEGDTVLLFDERMNIAVDTRIVEIVELFDEDENIVSCDVTLSNFSNFQTQEKRMQKATKAMADALEGKRPLPFETLDIAVQQATLDLQSAQTELVFDNGIIAVEKTDPNKLVLFNSAGLGISEDGGATFKTAMTGSGIVADVITTGTLNANEVRIFGGDADTYTYMDGAYIEVHGFYERRWFDVSETVDSRISIGDGFVKLTKMNDERGPRNLYLSNNGISTYFGGATPDTDEGLGSGVIEFWSHMYDTERRGLTLYSNLGTIGLRTSSRDVVLDANRDVSVRAQIGRVLLRPKDGNRSGDNEFSFNIKENSDKWLQDGWIQFGAESNGYASGLRFSKDPADPALYATNGSGDFFSGDFHAKDIYAHGKFNGDVVGSLIASAINSYAMVDGEFRITDKRGYNDGNITYKPITASEFNTASNRELKKNIEDYTGNATELINDTPVRHYHLQADVDEVDPKRVGLIVQESPMDIVNVNGGDSINIYAMASVLWKFAQEASARLDALEAK